MTADNAASSSHAFPAKQHITPARTNTIGMYLFLVALAVLFASSMAGYVLVRTGVVFGDDAPVPGQPAAPAASQVKMPPLGFLEFPKGLWLSTVLVFAASVTIQKAVTAVRRERQADLRKWLNTTLVLSAAFVVVQAPSMWLLLSRHGQSMGAGGTTLYGLVFFFILLHALHVVGGVVALAVNCVKARRGAYDHEHYAGVRFSALYWHFLDGVWMFMFGTMFLFG
jgi:heme/copper-type cytochrome/quinol oxidase subunit 3